MAEQSGARARAEAAFASYLARVNGGEEVDFEAYCAERSDLADSLRALHAAWQEQGSSRRGQVQSIRDFLSERLGPDTLGADAPRSDSGVRERLKRLASRTGRYTLREEVARGGMGVILRVWDEDLRRNLAMKATFGNVNAMTEEGAPSGDMELVSRFLEEAQITGQLEHPGIVPVHELGVDNEGRMFFTMLLVKGRTLHEIITLAREEADGWTRTRALGVILRICEAMAYAHSKGVIHRDIKPANVMVGKFGEVYVMDWGLAKVVGAEDTAPKQDPESHATLVRTQIRTDRDSLVRSADSAAATMQGTIIGTPAYMPPEQAEGRVDALDPRSDVYSVGCLLYTLLTGWMPYVDPAFPISGGKVLVKLMAGPPKPVLEIDSGVPAELVSICEKAMARLPELRYESMLEMAEDVRRFMENRVVLAHRTGAVAELRKWVDRNRGIAAAICTIILLTVCGLMYVAWQQRQRVKEVSAAQARTDKERARAERSAEEARANLDAAQRYAERAERNSYLADLAAAHASLRMLDTREALRLLQTCPARYRGWEWHHLRLRVDTSRALLLGHTGKVTAVAFGPGGARVLSGAADKSVRLWDGASGEALFTLPGAGEEVTAVAYGPKGARVAAATKDMIVRVWDANGGRLLGTLTGHEAVVSCIAFSPDGARIATGNEAGVVLWDAQTLQRAAALPHEQGLSSLAFAPDGKRLATGTDDGVHVWDVADGKLVRTLPIDEGATCVAFGERIAAGSLDASVHVFDPASGERVLELSGHADPVSSVALAAGGARLVSGSYDRTIRVWDLQTGLGLAVLQGHEEAVLAVDCSGGRVVSASADGTLRLWDMEAGEAVLTLRGDEDFLSDVAFDPGGKTVAAASAGHGEIRIWDAATGRAVRYIPEHGGGLSSLAISHDGKWIVAGGEEDATANIMDTKTGDLLRSLTGHEASVSSVAISPDGARVVTGSADLTVRIWDAASGRQERVLEGHAQRVAAVAFSPDGGTVLSASFDGTIRVWDAATGRERRVIEGSEGAVLAAVFSPDGKTIASAGADHQIRFWDAATGAPRAVLAGHAAAVSSLAFSPDGARLASGGHDKTVRIWDAATAELLVRLSAHDGWVTSVAFSPDGKSLVSASFDTTARIWRTTRNR